MIIYTNALNLFKIFLFEKEGFWHVIQAEFLNNFESQQKGLKLEQMGLKTSTTDNFHSENETREWVIRYFYHPCLR